MYRDALKRAKAAKDLALNASLQPLESVYRKKQEKTGAEKIRRRIFRKR